MRHDDIERSVQDYLDGRLSPADRQAFEKKLGEEPGLRRRVEAYRKLGDALRESTEDLSPGFYARARARFEESRKPRSVWRWVISWEAAGLAAAAMLLVAVLAPDLLKRESSFARPASHPGLEAVDSARPVPKGEAAPMAREERAREQSDEALRDGSETASAPARPEGGLAHDVGGVEWGGDKPARGAEKSGPRGAPAAVEPEEAEIDAEVRYFDASTDKVEMKKVSAAEAPLRAVPERSLSLPRPRARTEEKRETDGDVFREKQSLRARPETGRFSPYASVPVPAGLVPPATVRVISTLQEWERFRAEAARGSIPLDPDFETQRVVLLGAGSSPMACDALRATRTDAGIFLEVSPPGPGVSGSPGGCAVLLPAGEEPVHLVENPGGPHGP